MHITEPQARAIYELYRTVNDKNEYILSLVSTGNIEEAECLARAMDNIANILKEDDYTPTHFTWRKKVKERSQLHNWVKNI